jgi:hypothetical protein
MRRLFAATRRRRRDGERGQILVIAVISLMAMIGGVALVLEGGNAYAHQRIAQNASDAVANAGAMILAQSFGGDTKADADVDLATRSIANMNALGSHDSYYTDFYGHMLTNGGAVTTNSSGAAKVGDGVIPIGTRGVRAHGTQTFDTSFARVLGLNQMTAGAEATAIAGPLTGGRFMPIVFPVNIVSCDGSGDLDGVGEAEWALAEPGNPPRGQEYIVPLCKTDAGSFMVLDLNGTPNDCDAEVLNPTAIQLNAFPADLNSDNGNNCVKPMVDAVNSLRGQVVLIPICDGDCVTAGGSQASYHIIKVAAFYLDYMSDQNGGINAACVGNGVTIVPITGNGSSSCLVGWFVRYVTSGPVGAGPITGSEAIGVQLIK